ncbi:MAG: ABC transporter permease, partial [Cyanobacteria bacterium P01_H01_bin.130]
MAAAKSALGAWTERAIAAGLLGGQTLVHMAQGKINRRNTLEQMQ